MLSFSSSTTRNHTILMPQIMLSFLLLLLFLNLDVQAHPSSPTGQRMSVWLNKMDDPRATGCNNRPWICDRVANQLPMNNRRRMMCCKNRCVEVSLDMNNCGACGVRCPFTWQCCNGACLNTNANPFNCGRCENRCQLGSLCLSGLCGYSLPAPLSPFPFPFPPRQPKPQPPRFPFPPKPPKAHPPSMP